MAFETSELAGICVEIRRRQTDAGRLSLVEFDDVEYAALLDWAWRIVREYNHWGDSPEQQDHARLVFLAFTMAFVRRNK